MYGTINPMPLNTILGVTEILGVCRASSNTMWSMRRWVRGSDAGMCQTSPALVSG